MVAIKQLFIDAMLIVDLFFGECSLLLRYEYKWRGKAAFGWMCDIVSELIEVG